jgi:exonuclease III
VLSFLHDEGHDIALLQECNLPYKSNYRSFQDKWKYGYSLWSGDNKNRSSGVGILFGGRQFEIQQVRELVNGRLLYVDVRLNGILLRIINVYCPPDLQERKEILKDIASLLLCGREVIMGGDFNCIIAKEDRKSTRIVKFDSSSVDLTDIIKDFKLTDVFRAQNPNTPGFTWSNGSSFSRIDFFFSSATIEVIESSVKPVFFSDHAKLDCVLDVCGSSTRGHGLWKLNTSLLEDSKIVQELKGKLNQWKSLQDIYPTVGDWWQDLKIRIKKFFMKESKKITSQNNYWFKKCQRDLQTLYIMSHSGFNVADDIVKLKREMAKIMADKNKSYIIRSRVQHLESNEKCTRYFFRKLTGSQSLDSIKIQENQVITGTHNIVSHVFSFYKNLYSSKNGKKDDIVDFLSEIDSNIQGDFRNDNINLCVDDLSKAVKSMSNNKCPGADGLPKEFYITFWEELKEPLLTMFMESLRIGKLPSSLREGVISLLFKKGDRQDIKNWRPLTLLGVDVKILSKALFLKLQPEMPKLISNDQTCGIKGRSIQDNLALARDIYLFAQDRKLSLAILGLDLEKAFDSIDHQYLHALLKRLGFSPTICAWISLLYTNCQSRVLVNNYLSEPFDICSGVRQGCSLSPLLFVLAIEPLACALRQNPRVKGFPVPGSLGRVAKVSLYMDDLTLFLTDNNSIKETLKTCERFTLATGAKINKTKTEVLYSFWKEPQLKLGFKNQEESIKILGLFLGKDMDKINWDHRLDKIKWKLNQWKERDLTLRGKVLIINAEILASLTFLASTFPAPIQFIRSIRKALFCFFWGSQHEKIRREILYKPINKGGLAVPELGTKLESMFVTPIVKACLSEDQGVLWHCFAKLWIGQQVANAWGMRLSQNTPHAEYRPKMYEKVLPLLRKLKASHIPIGKLNRATIQEMLYPGLERITPVGNLIESDCITVWKNVDNSFLFNSHKDIAWQVVHQCLPTRVFLKKRNCSKSSQCPKFRCGEDESISHLFWSCKYAREVWSLVREWMVELYRFPTESDLMYGELNSVNSDEWIRWWIAINVIKEGIWKARNISCFKGYDIPAETVISSSLVSIRDYVLKDRKTFSFTETLKKWKVSAKSPILFYLQDEMGKVS